jgi:hypothetical protein
MSLVHVGGAPPVDDEEACDELEGAAPPADALASSRSEVRAPQPATSADENQKRSERRRIASLYLNGRRAGLMYPHAALRSLSLVAFAVFVAACGPNQDDLDRLAVAKAIDDVRNAPPEDHAARAKLASALAALDVHAPDAVRARDACSKAYGALAESMRLTAVASAGLDPKSSADPTATLQALSDADAKGKESETAMSECADASAAIRTPAKR